MEQLVNTFLEEGSLLGFMKGKLYNRCTRIHELLANVLKHQQFLLEEVPAEEYEGLQEVVKNVPTDFIQMEEGHLENPIILEHLRKFKDFFLKVCNGEFGATAQF